MIFLGKITNTSVERKAATPAGKADVLCAKAKRQQQANRGPGLSVAREAARCLPAESVRL